MYCVMCGAENPEYGKYCHKCGKVLIDGEQQHTVQTPIALSALAHASSHRRAFAPVADRLEIKPNAGRNAVILILLCSLFSIGGFFLVATGEPKAVAAGLLSIVFFGGGGLIAIPKMLRRKVSMVLTREGMEQINPYGKSFIRWIDVEKLGVVSVHGNEMVGIRLRSYDAHLQSMSPELMEHFLKTLPYMKLVARGASMLEGPAPYELYQLWSQLKGSSDPREAMKAVGKIGSYVEALLWTRQQYGYDFVIAWSDRDRSASAFLALLGTYCPEAAVV